MKKIFLAIFISAFFSIFGFGQSIVDSNLHKQKTTAFISINGGVGIPSNNLYMEELAGGPGGGSYGKIGYNLTISGAIAIAHSHFGIIGVISYNAEPFNVNQCFLDLCNKTNTNQLTSGNNTDFKEILLMPGVFFSLPGKPTIDFRLLVGDNLYRVPGYTLVGTSTQTYGVGNPGGGSGYTVTNTSDISASLQSANSSAMAFDFGVDLRFIQGEHFFGVLSSDFMYSQAYINTIFNEANIWNGKTEHYRVNYNLLSFMIGVGCKF